MSTGEDRTRTMALRRVRRSVSQYKVRKTYITVSEMGQYEMSKVLSDAVPGVVDRVPSSRQPEVQKALAKVTSRAGRRLATVRVPRTFRDTQYNYDRVVGQREDLQGRLGPLLEQEAALKREILIEEANLKDDKMYLERLRRQAAQTPVNTTELLDTSYSSIADRPVDIDYETPADLNDAPLNRELDAVLARIARPVAALRDSLSDTRRLVDACERVSELAQSDVLV